MKDVAVAALSVRLLGLHRLDLGRLSGSLLGAKRQGVYVVGQLVNLAAAVTLAAIVALIVGNQG